MAQTITRQRLTSALQWIVAVFALVFSSLLLFVGDSRSPLSTDYIQFYAAGHMVNAGEIDKLYLPLLLEVSQSPFPIYAANLPGIGKEACINTTVFNYHPFVALLFAPLAALPYKTSLLVWQGISVACLIGCGWLFCRTPNAIAKTNPLKLLVLSLVLLNVAQILVMGHFAIVFTLLPWVGAYYCWNKEKPVMTAFCLAILALKISMLLPAILVCGALLLTSRRSTGVASKATDEKFTIKSSLVLCITAGAAAALLAVLPMVIAPDMFARWTHQLKSCFDHLYGPYSYDPSYWALASLPATISVALPVDARQILNKTVSYFSTALTAIEFAVLYLVATTRNISKFEKLDLLILIAFSFLPLTSLYLCSYDFVTFLLPGWIIATRVPEPRRSQLMPALILMVLAQDAYYLSLPFLVPKGEMVPAQILLQFLLTSVCAIICSVGLRTWHTNQAANGVTNTGTTDAATTESAPQ